jgi:precorrin-6B methylase 2
MEPAAVCHHDLDALLKQALDARRREDWTGARQRFGSLLEAAETGNDAEHAAIARGHLGILDGDQNAAEGAVAQLIEIEPESAQLPALGMLMAERWAAAPRQTETHLVARAGTFRKLSGSLPRPGEVALELGAAHGLATQALAERCEWVYAVEKSAAMLEKARRATADLPNVRLFRADAEHPGLVRAHVPRADLVFLDIGGSAPAAQVLHLGHLYRELYQPRALVMRCVYLNNFVAGLASAETTYGPSIWTKPDESRSEDATSA